MAGIVTTFGPMSGDGGKLQGGVKWGGPYGSGAELTYAFPGSQSAYGSGYGELGEAKAMYRLTGTEQSAVREALAQWAGAADLTLIESGDAKNAVMRFAVSEKVTGAAHAYLPDNAAEAGDVWFATGWHKKSTSAVEKGTYDYLVILHEIGHALGLEHSFHEETGKPKVAKAHNNFAYTIMSYTAAPRGDHGDNQASFYPTTPMYYDLVAIQGMYGRGVHNPGDDTYTFKAGRNYWQTIDDSGGTDAIAYKGGGKAVINLNVGKWSDLGKSIEFAEGKTRWTVAIGPDTVIENAFGGRGKDKLIGNDVANVLDGGKGKDILIGGGGADTFLFAAALKKGNLSTVKDFKPGVDVIQIRQKFAKALDIGEVSEAAFAEHFDYRKGKLFYDDKLFAKFNGKPAIDADDILVM